MSAFESLAVGLLALAAARWGELRWPTLAGLAAIPLALLWLWVGLRLPDIDQPLPLDHRSALTHSVLPLVPALLRRWTRPLAAGLALGLGVHLVADLFPESMTGFATVKLPLAGSLEGWSYAWLGANMLIATWLGARLLRAEVPSFNLRLLVLVAALLIALWYLGALERSPLALLLYAGVAWTMLLPRRERDGL